MTILPSAPGDPSARGIYIHIPFCIVRCAYCDFNAYAGMDDLMGAYVQALKREIGSAADGGRVATVFFGGGTPTQLPPESLGEILRAAKESFDIDDDAEISIEANPESVTEATFESLLGAGFNRVSIGVQSTSAHVLQKLGRVHDAERALDALREARRAGFTKVNADLIFGTPGESMKEWRRSLETVLESGVDHISCYALTIEEGTPLASWVELGRFPAPDEDDQADKYGVANQILSTAGFFRYEISNWAKLDSWCRHNVNYWTGGNYLGFGAGAHGHSEGRRSWNVKSPRGFIERGNAPNAHAATEDGFEVLYGGERAEEALILGLRLAGGVNIEALESRYCLTVSDRCGAVIERLRDEQLIEVAGGRLRLTERGFMFANRVAVSLMGQILSTRGG